MLSGVAKKYWLREENNRDRVSANTLHKYISLDSVFLKLGNSGLIGPRNKVDPSMES